MYTKFSSRAPPPSGHNHGGDRNDPTTTTTTILARVGVSLISTAQACANAEAEIPDFDFGRVRGSARARWAELLGRVEVEAGEGQREEAVLFYSSVSTCTMNLSMVMMDDSVMVFALDGLVDWLTDVIALLDSCIVRISFLLTVSPSFTHARANLRIFDS